MALTENKSNLLLLILCFIGSAWGMASLTGCGGTGNIQTASVAESGRVELSWEEVPGARAYNLYMSTAPGVNKLNGYRISRATSPLTVTGLETGTTYFFVLTVIDASGEGLESKEVSYTAVQDESGSIKLVPALKEPTPENRKGNPVKASGPVEGADNGRKPSESRKPDTVAPNSSAAKSAPNNQNNAPEKASEKMTVAWDSIPNAASYNIYWRTTPGVTKQNGKKIPGVKSPYTFTGLKRGVTYYFVVTSVSQAGESQESEELSISVPK